MDHIPVDLIRAEPSIQAGLAAMERIHGRHLGEMTPEEQEHAREHWRAQVEEILTAVREVHAPSPEPGAGRAVVTFVDVGGEHVDVEVSFEPDLVDLPTGEVEGTPAQLLALTALESVADPENGDPGLM